MADPMFTSLPGVSPTALPGAAPGQGNWWDSLVNFGQPAQSQTQANPAIPPVNAPLGGTGANTGLGASLGANIGTGQLAVGGLSALGNLWTAWNATNLAKQSFNFNKTLATDNYTNSADAYNSAVADKANTRAVMENQTPGQAQSYIAANSVKNTI